MEKYVKWRDSSFKMSQDPERWVPEAKAAAYEMVKRAVLKEWSIPEERIQEY
jgi:hypothetical protein